MKNRLYKPFLLPYNYKKYNVIPGPQTFDGTVLGTISASSGEFTWDIYYGNGLIKVDGTNNWSLNNFNHQTSTGYVLRDYDIGEYSKYYVITVSFNGSVLFRYAGWGGKIRYLKNTKQFTLYKGNDTFVYRSSGVSTPTYNNWGVPTDGSFVQDVASQTEIYRTDAVEIVGLYMYPVNTAPGEFVIDDSHLYGGVEYMCNINADKDITVGTTASAQIEFTTDLLNTNAAGTTLNFEQMQADETTYTQKGVFTISNIEKTRNGVYKVTAYDNVSKFDIDVKSWITSLNWSQTVNSFFKGLCTYCGVTHTYSASQTTGEFINDDIVITRNVFGGDVINGRTILGYIAAVAGGFVVADSDGDISIKHFGSTSTHTFPRAEYKKATYSDYNAAPIETVKVSNGADDVGITVGDGDNPLLIQYNAIFYNEDIDLMEDAVENIYDVVTTYSYRPCTLELFSDYGVNVGDKITVNYGDGTFNSYVFNKKINNNGVVLESTGNPTREKLTNMGVDEVQALVGKTNKLTVDVNGIKDEVIDTETGNYKVLTWDADSGLVVCNNVSGNTVSISGDNIAADAITAEKIYAGSISFDKCNSGMQDRINAGGQTYKQSALPNNDSRWVTTGNNQGAYWYVTAIPSGIQPYSTLASYSINDFCSRVDGGTVYYICKEAISAPAGLFDESKWEQFKEDNWYTWNGTCWNLSTSPYYIKSTYIDGAKIASPTIYGNEIKVLDGKFMVMDAQDSLLYGYMGIGQDTDAGGNINTGVLLSASDDTTLGTQDAYVLLTTNGVRITFSDYSILVKNNGVFYEKQTEGGTQTIELGVARFS